MSGEPPDSKAVEAAEALEALGIHPIPVPIPFAHAGGPVNAYAVDDADGGLLLVDTAYGSPEATGALAAGFDAAGLRFEDVQRIVVTHGHVDHFGGARFVLERAGREIPVHAHPADAPKIAESGPRWRELAPLYAAHLAKLGVPLEVLAAMAGESERSTRAPRVPRVEPLGPGVRFRTRHLDLEVLPMPGHTPGLVCLYDRAHGILFSNDHVLERISPNPLLELGPDGADGFFRPLVAYLESAARTRALEVATVLPGHGPPFGGHRAVLDRLAGFYVRRQVRLLELLADGPRSPFALARLLFREFRPSATFLVLSEVMGNLEVLEAGGAIAREERDGLRTYRRTSATLAGP